MGESFSLGHAYEAVHGAGPKDGLPGNYAISTRTQEFQGALDHTLYSKYAIRIIDALEMPTLRELDEKKEFHPNMENEPSDHLMQKTVFAVL